jgi:arylsulfatase A-like enzyme
LGNDKAREWATSMVSGMVTEANLTWYRQDFNTLPHLFWVAADAASSSCNSGIKREGLSEALHIAGLYRFWDDLRAKHDGLSIDNCASGGRRIDLETLRRSVPLWRSDHCWDDPASQAMAWGLSHFLPFHGLGATSSADYTFRSGMGSVVSLVPNMYEPPPDLPAWVEDLDTFRRDLKRLGTNGIFGCGKFTSNLPLLVIIALWVNSERLFVMKDFYALSNYSTHVVQPPVLAPKGWIAWQYHNSSAPEPCETEQGVVLAFRRAANGSQAAVSRSFALRGVDPSRRYAVSSWDSAAAVVITGSELLAGGVNVSLPPHGSAVMPYRCVHTPASNRNQPVNVILKSDDIGPPTASCDIGGVWRGHAHPGALTAPITVVQASGSANFMVKYPNPRPGCPDPHAGCPGTIGSDGHSVHWDGIDGSISANTDINASAPPCTRIDWCQARAHCDRAWWCKEPWCDWEPPPAPPRPPAPPPPPTPLPVVPTPQPPLGYQPNIILFLTDDQDEVLGSRMAMPQAKELLTDRGATAVNWFIFTPVCCPSRAEYLTGRMFHRLRINGINGTQPGEGPPHVVVGAPNGGCRATNGNGCMCVNTTLVNTDSFPMYLTAAGYTVGMFGKHLNQCPSTMPAGFDRWFANDGGNYVGPNCKFFDNEAPGGSITCEQVQNQSGYGAGYETSVIGNKTVEWIKKVGSGASTKPFMAYVGVHAPHLPSTPAPWYKDHFNDTALEVHYKTPNFNVLGADHHWLVAQQPPLSARQKGWIDMTFRNRWRTLLSHDDLIAAVVGAVDDLGLLDKTFFFSTSDHGYNLGQLRLSGCKLHPYDNDLKIPMIIRGPGVAPGSVFSHVGQNLDLAPTFLDLAGIKGAGDMDGQSLLGPLLIPATPPTRLYTYHEYNSLGNTSVNGGLDDDPISHTWRAVRFPHTDTFGHALMYAEFTQLDNWNYDFAKNPHAYSFFELFDTTADPWQTTNLYYTNATTARMKKALHELVVANFQCRRSECFKPIKYQLEPDGINNLNTMKPGLYTRLVGVLPSNSSVKAGAQVAVGIGFSVEPCVKACDGIAACSGFAVMGQNPGEYLEPVWCQMYEQVAWLENVPCKSDEQYSAFFMKPGAAIPGPIPYQQFAGLMPAHRSAVTQKIPCDGKVEACTAACAADSKCVGFALPGCQPEAAGAVCWTYHAGAVPSLQQNLVDNACYYQKPGVRDVPLPPAPNRPTSDHFRCGPPSPAPPDCTWGCKFGASQWSDGTPTFNCKMRKLAWEFGQKLMPRMQTFEDLYWALGLNEDCLEEVPPPAFTAADRAPPPSVFPPSQHQGISLYVDNVKGSDDNAGSLASPFKTIQAAVDAAANQPYATINLRGGTHYLTKAVQISAANKGLAVQNYKGEVVTVSGAVRLDVKWVPHKVGGGKNMYSADTSGSNVTEVPGFQINGVRLTRARYPNGNVELTERMQPGGNPDGIQLMPGPAATWVQPDHSLIKEITQVLNDDPAQMRNGSVFRGSLVYTTYMGGIGGPCAIYDPPFSYWCSDTVAGGGAKIVEHLRGVTPPLSAIAPPGSGNATAGLHLPYKTTKGAIVNVMHPGRWANWMWEVEAIAENNSITFGRGGFQESRGNLGTRGGGDWFIENVWEEFDSVNEFFWDKSEQKLFFFYNGTGPPPASADYEVPQLRTLFNLTSSRWQPIVDVTIRGLTLTGSRYTYMDPHAVPSGGDFALARSGAVFLEGTERVSISDCNLTRLDGNGITISGYNRNATVARNALSYIGDNAVVVWGYTNETGSNPLEGFDGTDGNHPQLTSVVDNVMREIGIYEKQSCWFFQAKAARSRVVGNVMFNAPRSGINMNDAFGGGDIITRNLAFSAMRETADGGTFNSWDRQPFLTREVLVNGEPSPYMAWREISHNFLINNYHMEIAVDTDDGSSYYKTHDNLLVSGVWVLKSGHGGHDNWQWNNLNVYPTGPAVFLASTQGPGY